MSNSVICGVCYRARLGAGRYVTSAIGPTSVIWALLRAIRPVEGLATMRTLRRARADRQLASGPGKLAQALAIDGACNGIDITISDELWVEPGEPIPDALVQRGPRIGIGYASERDQQRPWRFWIAP